LKKLIANHHAKERATKKNGIDPLFHMIFASLASTGRDINFDMGRIGGYRKFLQISYGNAARYVMMNAEGQDTGVHGGDLDKPKICENTGECLNQFIAQ